jgi:hypothetical protein
MAGISARHGAHQVAQKLRMTTFPLACPTCTLTELSSSLASISGAGSPTAKSAAPELVASKKVQTQKNREKIIAEDYQQPHLIRRVSGLSNAALDERCDAILTDLQALAQLMLKNQRHSATLALTSFCFKPCSKSPN